MSAEKDKDQAKLEGVDVSGYMPPGAGMGGSFGPGAGSPYVPVSGPGMPCPGMVCPNIPEQWDRMGVLACVLKKLENQQVTVYVSGLGPAAATPVLPSGGGLGVVPGTGVLGLTGMLHEVGRDYIELHVDLSTTRVVYTPLMSVAAIVPGGPLAVETQPNMVTTVPDII